MGTSASDNEFDLDSVKDWATRNSRSLMIGGGVVVVLGAGYLFASKQAELKNARAEAAYATAQGTFYSGNATQAKTDLEKAVDRYKGTNGGTQGAMLLAQILYGEGKFDDGIKVLTGIQGSAPSQFASAIEELIGSGYADSKRPAEAADHYLKAAERSPFPAEKDSYTADAARVLMMAGKAAEAKTLWQKLAANTESNMATEAKVRLGELEAKPVAP
jgi:predicted negative regulator of RcsB-dependent stress response